MTHHSWHLPHIAHLTQSKKSHIVLSLAVHQFAFGMMAIFVPIYLITIGYSLRDSVVFILLTQVFTLPLMWPAMSYILRFGVHHALSISYVFTAAYVAGLYLAQYEIFGLVLAGIFAALMQSIYWPARWIDLARVFNSKHMSESIGNVNILSILATGTAPIIGGAIADIFSPSTALISSFFVFILAIAVMRKELSAEKGKRQKYSLKISISEMLRDSVANIGSSFQSHVGVFMWPIYIYLIHDTFSSVGLVIGIAGFLSIFLIRLVTKMNDQHRIRVFPIGIFIRSSAHLIRSFTLSIQAMLGANLLATVANVFYDNSFVPRYMNNAKNAGYERYVFYFETIGRFGAITAWSLLFILLLNFDEQTALKTMLILGAPATLISAIIRPGKI